MIDSENLHDQNLIDWIIFVREESTEAFNYSIRDNSLRDRGEEVSLGCR